MKSYILTVIGAAVLSSFGTLLAPEKWRKYVNLITGLVIISCIMTPIAKLTKTDLFSGFNAIENTQMYEEYKQSKIILDELEKRVCDDIEKRLENEFGIEAKAEIKIDINENNEITGIRQIHIKNASLTKAAKERLCYIYGINEAMIKDE